MRSDRGNALGISATAPPDVAQPGGTTSAIVASAMSMAAIRACDLIIARGTLLMNNAEAGATAPLFGSDTN
jgi:hypothetical protein